MHITAHGAAEVASQRAPDSGELLVSLHETVGPAILTNVPPYFHALLTTGFSPLSARKVLRAHGITGERRLWRSEADLDLLLSAVDDKADVVLDLDELLDPER